VKQNFQLIEHNNFGRKNQQLILPIDTEILIPEQDPVRLASAQLEELDYRKLYRAYSAKGRKSAVEPRIMFEVLVYGYMCGIYSSREIEEACRKRVDFMWLLDGEPVPDHTTIARFRSGRGREAIEDLFYQYIRHLEEQGETDHEAVFIDGTKLESAANCYTFLWKKSIEKSLSQVKESVRDIFAQKQIAGNVTLRKLRSLVETEESSILFVHGTGKRKSPEQKKWEKLNDLLLRWEKYEQQLFSIGNTRNSCSKTDPDATFMRMKEDHMRNGQLKPAYNVQIAVNSEYITGIGAFSNRTDSGTLVPFLHHLEKMQGKRYDAVVADAGYESLGNYLYLDAAGQMSFIKPINYETLKSKQYKAQVGRSENMQYLEDEDSYVCAAGRKLKLRRESTTKNSFGQYETTAYYRCDDCSGCAFRNVCSKASDGKTKELQIKPEFREHRATSLQNISTERGIILRMNRSIQVEGAFGVLKADYKFRRFLLRSRVKISTELHLLALAYDLKKLWAKLMGNRLQTHLFARLKA